MSEYRIGCYGDRLHGHQHTREIAAYVMERAAIEKGIGGPEVAELVSSLRSWGPDDLLDESEACSWLDENTDRLCGHFWGWVDGDFGLWPLHMLNG